MSGINPEVSKWLSWYRKSEQVILGLIGLLLVVLLWEVASALRWINPVLMSSPTRIFKSAVEQVNLGGLWTDLGITLLEFTIAFLMASILGVLIGMTMGWYQRVEYAADPFLWIFYSTPLIAFYPLFIIWFGLGFKTVVMLGFLLAIIPIIVNTFSGFKGTNPILIRAARSFGARDWQIIWKIAFPSALPMILTGLRICVERVLIGVIVGEMFSSNVGLGYRISYFGAQLQTSNVFVSIILVVIFGLLLTQLLRLAENHFLKWQR